MPCDSSHLEPTLHEVESKHIAKLIVFAHKKIGKLTKKPVTQRWVTEASKDCYGNVDRIDELTQILCTLCKEMPVYLKEVVIYDAHDRDSRDLATWWEDHKEVDKKKKNKRNKL